MRLINSNGIIVNQANRRWWNQF